jgi:hypothetical protein
VAETFLEPSEVPAFLPPGTASVAEIRGFAEFAGPSEVPTFLPPGTASVAEIRGFAEFAEFAEFVEEVVEVVDAIVELGYWSFVTNVRLVTLYRFDGSP